MNFLCFQEAEIKLLLEEVERLKNGNIEVTDDNITPELEKLRTENSKLKYQINHLKRVRIAVQNDWCIHDRFLARHTFSVTVHVPCPSVKLYVRSKAPTPHPLFLKENLSHGQV